MNSALQSVSAFYRSSIGKKLIVAITGLAMVGFLVGHLVGNLKIFAGPEKLNAYAAFLHSMPGVLWMARIGLLVFFFGHIITTILLVKQNRAARGSQYAFQTTNKASGASRTMIWSGIIILVFVVYHLMHYTVRIGNEFGSASYIDAQGRHNVYKMVVDGFSFVPVSLFYIFAMALLCWHLSHGFASCFQTLGLRTDRSWPFIKGASIALAAGLFIGNCAIPIAVMAKLVQ